MTEGKFYKKLGHENLQCQLCQHYCFIKDKKEGICRARINRGGKLYSLVYGFPVAQNVDPVEKKPLFHYYPGSYTYSFGTLGCNLHCANCQNWQISQAKQVEEYGKKSAFISPERIVNEALSNGCRSIAYTYNEPTIFTEYALDIMKLARENELKNVWVSNGYMSRACLSAIIPYLDAINVDLKSMSEDFYKDYCGARLKPILENLKILNDSLVHLEITSLIIPGLTDDPVMLNQLAAFIAVELDLNIPWHISKFSPDISWKLKKAAATSDELVYTAWEIGREAGLNFVYAGNLPGDERENTYCPSCGELAIRRFGYEIERFDNHGRCDKCDKDLEIFS